MTKFASVLSKGRCRDEVRLGVGVWGGGVIVHFVAILVTQHSVWT